MTPSEEPTIQPSEQPTSLPTMNPSEQPTPQPTEQPTSLPTFRENNYENEATLKVLLLTEEYVAADVLSDTLLEKHLIFAVKTASVTVRYEIQNVNAIGVDVDNVVDYDVNEINGVSERDDGEDNEWWSSAYDNRTYTGNTSLEVDFTVSFKTAKRRKRWFNDLRFVMIEFQRDLRDYWGINDLQAWVLDVDYDGLFPTTTDEPTTTAVTTVVIDASDDDLGLNSNAVIKITANTDEAVKELEDYYNMCMIGVILIACMITGFGLLDAKYGRHNELLKLTTMVIVTMYLLDVVSGKPICFFLFHYTLYVTT